MEVLYYRLKNIEEVHDELKTLWQGLLKRGKIFFYPTETIYGLGAAPHRDEWIQSLYEVKGRSENKPLPLIASSLYYAREAWAEWNQVAERLVEAFWPGPLTIVLKASSKLPRSVHAGTGKIGIRVSSNPLARLLAELAGGLIVATSANPSGKKPISDPALIPKDIKKSISVIIDSGVLSGFPSTVVDCSDGGFRILREGAITERSLKSILKKINEQ